MNIDFKFDLFVRGNTPFLTTEIQCGVSNEFQTKNIKVLHVIAVHFLKLDS